MPSRPGELHPESLTDPDVILSHHPARATMRRLPPSVMIGLLPLSVARHQLTRSNVGDPPPSPPGHYPASTLLRGSAPLAGASVLSASRLEPLAPFPLA